MNTDTIELSCIVGEGWYLTLWRMRNGEWLEIMRDGPFKTKPGRSKVVAVQSVYCDGRKVKVCG